MLFDDDDKISIVSEYVTSGRPAQEIIAKYHLSSRQVLFSWMDKYVNEREIVSLPENEEEMANKTPAHQGTGGGEQAFEQSPGTGKAPQRGFQHNDRPRRKDLQHPCAKKIWHQTVELLRRRSKGVALGLLCGLFGYSRQSYYKWENREFAEDAMEPLIVEKVREYRRDNPGLGCAKLYLIVKKLFDESGTMPGRDVFIELLRKNGLMVRLKRRRRYKTTDSNHHYRKYPNLIADVVPSRPNEIWVSDITYVETLECVCYLSLITDAYSHKIVGWAVGPTLETLYPLAALRMALSTIDDATGKRLIHHSDRGCQYCSHEYVAELKKYGVSISMTQSGDPLENAIAERANGILKVEWLYKMTIANRDECQVVLDRIIGFYNTERPHMSIGMQTPEAVHRQTGEQHRCWKNSYAMG